MTEQTFLWDREAPGPRRGPSPLAVRLAAVTGAAALVLGLIAGPILSNRSTAAADSTTQEHTISVSGAAIVSVKPDVADVTIGVSAEKPTAKEARDSAATAMTALIAALKKNGIADKDIVTVNISLEPVYEYSSQKPRLTGQRFTNIVRVTVRNIDSLASVVDDSVAAGATQISGIAFRLSDPKVAQAQARQGAMEDARAKADALARAGGVTIKGVASISETSYSPPTPQYASYDGVKMQAAGAPSTPVQTGTTDVQIQVSVTYLLG